MSKQAIFDLNAAWNDLCPKEDRGHVFRLRAELIEDGVVDTVHQCRSIVGALYDGLAYGNWPSAVAAMGKYEAQP
jgi:hypothetical protein